MASSRASLPAFSLLRFTLTKKPDGTLTQHREILGSFADAELAFVTARARAWEALCQHAQVPAPGVQEEAVALEVLDTDWGYDLRRNGQIIDRFWVHDRAAKEL